MFLDIAAFLLCGFENEITCMFYPQCLSKHLHIIMKYIENPKSKGVVEKAKLFLVSLL